MKLSPDERKNVILQMLEETGRLSVDVLVERLGISPMTANRDIRELAGEGKIRRLHGLILMPEASPQPGGCALCHREVSDRSQFIYLFNTRKTNAYCCPHCGLSELHADPAPTAVFASDFLYGTLIDAYTATYLIGSRIGVCCAPSALCFARIEDATDFQKGFGGDLYSLESAAQFLYRSRRL